MKRSIAVILSFILLVLALVIDPARAQQKAEKTLKGEIVDVIAFVSSGPGQAAEAVSKSGFSGNPLGFYDTTQKKLYLVGVPEMNGNANKKLLPYVGLHVFVIGKVYAQGGVNLILVSTIGKAI